MSGIAGITGSSFYEMGDCVYTAQGEMVCNNKKRNFSENFIVQETPNMGGVSKGDLVSDALNQNYCEISAVSNPQKGEIQYVFKKDCTKK
jgi:hypothetical protein